MVNNKCDVNQHKFNNLIYKFKLRIPSIIKFTFFLLERLEQYRVFLVYSKIWHLILTTHCCVSYLHYLSVTNGRNCFYTFSIKEFVSLTYCH